MMFRNVLLLALALAVMKSAFGGVCLCGEAPERANDFYWENDRTGFRAYGPGDFHKWSGIDVFNKNTSSNIVHSWLRRLGPPCDWHKNVNGLGMDDYAVGPGRGVGGVALRKDGKWLADYGDWTEYRIVTNGDERCAFELDYRLPIGGTMTLAIELKRGHSLFREVVSFSPDTPLAGVEVGVGLDLNASREHVGELTVDDKAMVVALFEKPHDRPGEEGRMMSALVGEPGQALALADEPNGAKMLMTKPLRASDANGRPVLTVYAGADWTEAGRFLDAASWTRYAKGFANPYLPIVEAAVDAYSDAEATAYLAEAEEKGVSEHGFPRLAANLGILVANGRALDRKDMLRRMMTVACRDARTGMMGGLGGGNEFSVKELVQAIVALERARAFPKTVTDGWRKDISGVEAARCYKFGQLAVGEANARNWVVFACASEQVRLANGMGGDPAFVEKYVADQLRFFDANGMYRDPGCPMVYDFVTRLQFAIVLANGYDGPSRPRLEEMMARSAEPTLRMLSACGEIPYGGRSNQFLHNATTYAALCEWYAAQAAKRGDAARAEAFRSAASRALASLNEWLAVRPMRHIRNFYPRDSRIGCEGYGYFNKYMVTMGSWAATALSFGPKSPSAELPSAPFAFETSADFHAVFLSAGDYSAQFDYAAHRHYDCDGLGRLQRRGAPGAICLSVPCPAGSIVGYRLEPFNDSPLAIMPVVPTNVTMCLMEKGSDGSSAWANWKLGDADWRCRLTGDGLVMTLSGKKPLALALPAFAFDGESETKIAATAQALAIRYGGWTCRYETDGTIVDVGRTSRNRNGAYRRFEARGRENLTVTVKIERN